MADSVALATVDEDRSLKYYEDVIERGRQTFIEVGNALMTIREQRLYREQGYDTFDAYCSERWGWNARRANQLMDAAEVIEQIGTTVPIPSNERQARELARLPDPETRREVWQATVEKHGEHVTAAKVKAEVEAVLPPKPVPVVEAFRPPSALGRAAEHYLSTPRRDAPTTDLSKLPPPVEEPEAERRYKALIDTIERLMERHPSDDFADDDPQRWTDILDSSLKALGDWAGRSRASLKAKRPLRAVK